MRKNQPRQAFTLTELLVTISIMSFIVGGILMGTIQMGRNIEKTRNYNFARKQLSSFVQTFYVFTNRSFGAYFDDPIDPTQQANYVTAFPASPTHSTWNTLYLIQDQAETGIGTLTYNPGQFTISYNRGGGAAAQVILRNVYRPDYINDATPGTAPIFRFPHRRPPILYRTDSIPNFLVVEFLLRIAAPTSTNPNPINIPVKLMYQL